jgi:predicted nucleic-acid-binding protein
LCARLLATTRFSRRWLWGLSQRYRATDRAFLNPIILVETAWTLRARYKYPKLEVLQHIKKLMGSEAYHVVDRDAVSEALQTSTKHSIDFADALIGEINRLAGCTATVTFDAAVLQVPGFAQLQ